MFTRLLSVAVLLVASLCVAEASAQCSAGVCRLPGRPVARAARVATAPVRALRAAQPLRRATGFVASVRPVRRIAGLVSRVRPVRRAAGWLIR